MDCIGTEIGLTGGWLGAGHEGGYSAINCWFSNTS